MTTSRAVYRNSDTRRLFHPAALAIVGISQNETSFGARTLANLHQFRGRIHLVNPKYGSLYGRPCYPSLAALPETPDCVLIAVPRDGVEAAIQECAARGVGGAIVYAAGYSETGRPELAAMQRRLTVIARESGLKILGPNCQGFINFDCSANVSFSAAFKSLPARREKSVGLASQSGALGFGLVQAATSGTSFSHLMACGNSCDVDIADQIAYLADDPTCQVIACVFEGTPSPRRLLEAGEIAASQGKPVVIYKLGVSQQGAAAAKSHTGSLAGSNAAYSAAFERAGFVPVDNIEALLETASFFAKAGAPKARGVAVVAASGGAAVIGADKAEKAGVALPQPADATRAVLERHIPDFGAAQNPCDTTASVMNDPQGLRNCVDAFLADDRYGAVVFAQPGANQALVGRVALLGEAAAARGKPVCLGLLSGWADGPGSKDAEMNGHVALFRSMERCMEAIAAWHRHDDRIKLRRMAAGRERLSSSTAAAEAKAVLGRYGGQSAVVTERDAKVVLRAYDVPVVEETLARSREEAVAAAGALQQPVVLKAESPDLPHKTEAGVVRLNLRGSAEVAEAYDAIMANVARVSPPPRLNGVIVQPMVKSGLEMMVGARLDPLFGPIVLVGFGGILVELMKDVRVALAPVGVPEARAMLDGLKGHDLLSGFRNMQAVDLDALAEIVARVSELMADHQDDIDEIDVNPLICAGPRIVAVDALIVRSRSGIAGAGTDGAV
jgi:acyl-CoA synthetase (NDP forming)